MDSITQATLGAAIGEATLGKKLGGKAAILGAIIGTIPDLDVVLVPFFNEFEKITLHRGYSHSLLLCFVLSIGLAFLLRHFNKEKKISFRKFWLFSFLTLFTHVLLDCFTAYGTQVFLPFTDWRVSFDSIGIVDPFYTVPLLLGLLFSVFYFKKEHRRRNLPNILGLLISTLYLIFTLAHKQQIEKEFSTQLQQNQILYYELLTVPVKVGNMVWYGVAKDETNLHIGKYSSLESNTIDFHSFPINDQLLNGLDEELVKRLKWFAKGFYTVAEKDGQLRLYNMQCDMQGVRSYDDYKAPTAFYYQINPLSDGAYELSSGMHDR